MKRNHLVLFLVAAALAAMFWAGWANYESRRQQQEKQRAMQAVLVPDGGGAVSGGGDLPPTPQLEGKPAPVFTLNDLSGRRVSLADYKGKAVLVNFWATWCGPCKVEIPWFIKLRDQYAGSGFEILGVSSDDLDAGDPAKLAQEKNEIAKFAHDAGMNYPVLLDGNSISSPYGGVETLPTSFYVNRRGTVVAETTGLVSRDEVEANIRKALGE